MTSAHGANSSYSDAASARSSSAAQTSAAPLIVVVQPRVRGACSEAAGDGLGKGAAGGVAVAQLACQLGLAGERPRRAIRERPHHSEERLQLCEPALHGPDAPHEPGERELDDGGRCAGLAPRLDPADAQRLGVRELAAEQGPHRFPLDDGPVR